MRMEKTLLLPTMLRDLQNLQSWPHDRVPLRFFHRSKIDVLEFQRDDVDRSSKPRHRLKVIIRGGINFIRYVPGRAVRFWGKDANPIAKLLSRHGKHPAQLPTTEYPNPLTRENGTLRVHHSCESAKTASV